MSTGGHAVVFLTSPVPRRDAEPRHLGEAEQIGHDPRPGTVIIQNAAGVIFTGTKAVDVGGIVATSQTVRAGRFQRDGSLRIDDTAPGGAGDQSHADRG